MCERSSNAAARRVDICGWGTCEWSRRRGTFPSTGPGGRYLPTDRSACRRWLVQSQIVTSCRRPATARPAWRRPRSLASRSRRSHPLTPSSSTQEERFSLGQTASWTLTCREGGRLCSRSMPSTSFRENGLVPYGWRWTLNACRRVATVFGR